MKTFRRLFLSFFSVTILLLLLELYFRFLNPQMDDKLFQRDPRLGWKFIPDKTGWVASPPRIKQKIHINPQGFRDKPFVFPDPSLKKIFVLGDSFTSNLSVPDEAVFTEVMERRLQNISVMNLGVNGYGQVQELLSLKQQADIYHPDLVIVIIYVLNDFIDNTSGLNWSATLFPGPYARWNPTRQDIEIIFPKRPAKTKVSLVEESHLAQFLIARWNLLRFKIGRFFEKNDYFSPESVDTDLLEMLYFRKNLSPEIAQSYRISERLLSMISRECKKRNMPHFFVIAPSREQVDPRIFEEYVSSNHKDLSRYDWLKPNKVLMAYAKKNNLNMLDLYPRLSQEHQRGKRLYDEDEEHWTIEGNEVVADELLKFIRSFSD